MLSYQHAYHAGNFADVHKHVALFCLLRALQKKDSAISFIDTHAGRGLYALDSDAAQKTGEYRDGIARLWSQRDTIAADSPLGEWLARLAELQNGTRLRRYPGSPWWLGQFQRRQDRLGLFELHPGEHRALVEQSIGAASNRRLAHADGLAALRKILPVTTPRLCVVIDPSYEVKNDYREVAKSVRHIAQKVRHAVVLLWYPLLAAQRHEAMLEALRAAGLAKLWRSEISMGKPAGTGGMHGSGLLLLNPPWQLDEMLDETFATLCRALGENARHTSRWWTGETAR